MQDSLGEEDDDFEDETDDRGGDVDFLVDFGSERKALIFREEGGDAKRSYSSMRFARSSSEVIDTRASRSSAGNWHRKHTAVPHISRSFNDNSVAHDNFTPRQQTSTGK
ncbi:hypothetical protein SLA2020_109930 [Shorea laevis]